MRWAVALPRGGCAAGVCRNGAAMRRAWARGPDVTKKIAALIRARAMWQAASPGSDDAWAVSDFAPAARCGPDRAAAKSRRNAPHATRPPPPSTQRGEWRLCALNIRRSHLRPDAGAATGATPVLACPQCELRTLAPLRLPRGGTAPTARATSPRQYLCKPLRRPQPFPRA